MRRHRSRRAVLHVEHNSVESFPRQSLGDGRLIHGDPSAQGWPLPASRPESIVSTESSIPSPDDKTARTR